MFRISGALDRNLRSGAFDFAQVVWGELDRNRSDIFIQARQLRRAGSEQPWLLRKQPSQRDLSRCCLLPLCDLAKEVNQGLVRFDCLRCKARENAAEI